VEGDPATFAIEGSETLIGRYDPVTDLRPDVDLTQVDLKRSVSRRHARIVRTGEGWVVTEEVGALNGTFVNGAKLVTGRPHPLADGDRLGLGMVKLVFRG
jgi:pSer/pThr/pTyr-binding forkhead associated (FHA) protein